MQYNLKSRTDEENTIIQQEIKNYFSKEPGSCDKTHTDHSKTLTKNRKYDRKQKWDF